MCILVDSKLLGERKRKFLNLFLYPLPTTAIMWWYIREICFNWYIRIKSNYATIIVLYSSVCIYFTLTFTNEIYVFICFCIAFYHVLISTWRTPLDISCKAGLGVTKFLSFCLSGKKLNSSSFLKINFAKYSILVWQFFSFSTLNISSYSLLSCKIAVVKCW